MAFKAGEWIAFGCAASAVLAAVLLLVGPRLLGWQGVIVLSGSMEPAMQVGDLAFVDPSADPYDMRVGDIITFRSPHDRGQTISHRVIEVVDTGPGLSYRTKGDANEDPDPETVPVRDIVGEVRVQLPYVGRVAQQLQDRLVFYTILGIPAALLIFHELGSIARQFKRKEGTEE
ncbi:MAG: signal peptidase I [Dehalococcoidia bacterium]